MLTELEIKEIEFSHLNLDIPRINLSKLRKPFAKYRGIEDYMEVMNAIRDPKNFYFTCKYIFNIEPTVFQLVWLEQLWKYPFPMLVANRGASKTFTIALYLMLRAFITQGSKSVISSATFRQAKYVFDYMETIWYNAPVLRDICGDGGKVRQGPSHETDTWVFRIGSSTSTAIPLGTGEKIRGLRAQYVICEEFNCLSANTLCETNKGLLRISDAVMQPDILLLNKDGLYEKPIRFIKTPLTEVYEVITERGYSFKCSSKHKVLTTNGFKLAKDLINGDCIISENKYQFPTELVKTKDLVMDENLAWMLGLLVSEGSVASKHSLAVQMNDEDCIKRFRESVLKINPNKHTKIIPREAYQDKRFKGITQKSYVLSICDLNLRNKLECLGLERVTAIDKKIPWSILQSPRYIIIKFLSGLFEGDGSAFLWGEEKQRNRLGVSYYSVSKQLAQEVHILLKKLGYLSNLVERTNHLSENIQYMVRLNGLYAYKFAKELNINKWDNTLNSCYEKDLEDRPAIHYSKNINLFMVNGRINGKHKTVGSSRSYDKAVEIHKKYNIEHLSVKSVKLLPEKEILYDFELPITHSFYANGMVQHNSLNPDIFEIVLRGFTATASNPVDNIKNFAKVAKLKEKGLWSAEQEAKIFYKPNQIVLSGTAGFEFQHFAKYWKRYHGIITSGGDPDKLHEALGVVPGKGFSHKDYVIIRIPVSLLPEGMMEEKAVENSRATMDKGRYECEFEACFSKDSNGFFRRSLIESCTTNKPILLPSGLVQFVPLLNGDQSCKYVMGVDPASESDNFAISILEIQPDHIRCVYGWTINRRKAFKNFTDKKSSENSFYSFINKKMRSLMQTFQIEFIGLDAGGGGIAVLEALHDGKNLESGDLPIFPIRQDDAMLYPGTKDYGYDDEAGLHILDMINFGKSEWVVEYNHGMRKALENKTLLFPHIDALSLTLAEHEDKSAGREIDTLEDLIYEIEQTKEELSCIIHSSSQTGRDRFDAPSLILQGGKIGRMRKDRYSALLIAFSVASRMLKPGKTVYSGSPGGFAREYADKDVVSNKMYTGPNEWFVGAANKSQAFGKAVNQEVRSVQDKNPFNVFTWQRGY